MMPLVKSSKQMQQLVYLFLWSIYSYVTFSSFYANISSFFLFASSSALCLAALVSSFVGSWDRSTESTSLVTCLQHRSLFFLQMSKQREKRQQELAQRMARVMITMQLILDLVRLHIKSSLDYSDYEDKVLSQVQHYTLQGFREYEPEGQDLHILLDSLSIIL